MGQDNENVLRVTVSVKFFNCHKQKKDCKLSYFASKDIFKIFLRMENIGQIYNKNSFLCEILNYDVTKTPEQDF